VTAAPLTEGRQEQFNLGLAGLVGTILMVLAAIQSLDYTVPLPHLVEPAVIAVLGSLALLTTLVVLRIAVPDRPWPLGLLSGIATTHAAIAWVVVAATADATVGSATNSRRKLSVRSAGSSLPISIISRTRRWFCSSSDSCQPGIVSASRWGC